MDINGVQPFIAKREEPWCITSDGVRHRFDRMLQNSRGWMANNGRLLFANLYIVSQEGWFGPYMDILECEAQLEYLKEKGETGKWSISNTINVQNWLGYE